MQTPISLAIISQKTNQSLATTSVFCLRKSFELNDSFLSWKPFPTPTPALSQSFTFPQFFTLLCFFLIELVPAFYTLRRVCVFSLHCYEAMKLGPLSLLAFGDHCVPNTLGPLLSLLQRIQSPTLASVPSYSSILWVRE